MKLKHLYKQNSQHKHLFLCIFVLIYLRTLEPHGYFLISSENNDVLLHSSFAKLNLKKVFGTTFEYEMYQEVHFSIYC